MSHELQELKTHLAELSDINAIAALLGWDQSSIMPAGAGEGRGRQIAYISRLSHEKFTSPTIGRLLDTLQKQAESWNPDSVDAALVRITAKDYAQATRVPVEFVSAFSEHTNHSYMTWAAARPANDFRSVVPVLEKTVELSRQLSRYQGEGAHIADALIDVSDSGMTVATLRPLFTTLRESLVPLVERIVAHAPIDDSALRGPFPIQAQLDYAAKLAERLGYDMNRGRLDTAPHPFCAPLHYGDVRITTRARVDDLGDSLFSVIHEVGHAMYEQGVAKELEGTPLAAGTSSGVHESQSRLWENIVGRSKSFWQHYYPELQATFPAQLGHVSVETFYRAINKVSRSLIRTDADEVTYNLHVIVRFELELELLEGTLAVKDLAEVWQERYQQALGIAPTDDKDGVLQDIHWYAGTVGGAFQGYTIGNIMSAQIYEAALAKDASIAPAIARGDYKPLLTWLQTHLYATGRRYDAPTTFKRVTGQELSIEPYFRYLNSKYAELYSL
ncbi:MAG: carboxypeptidase M32 [Chloroflexi bacterium]|nr:carboxypeptidase M32 [Chloroflexota bacterium]